MPIRWAKVLNSFHAEILWSATVSNLQLYRVRWFVDDSPVVAIFNNFQLQELTMLNCELLEARDTPSAAILDSGLLTVTVTGNGIHTVSVDTVNGQTQVNLDGSLSLFDGVTQLAVAGSKNGSNYVQNNTAIGCTLLGGNRDDTLFGGTGLNSIDPGKGDDNVYALLGQSSITATGEGKDRIFTNSVSTVAADSKDLVVKFFGAGRTPGSGFVGFDSSLSDGVLYIAPTNGGTFVQIDPIGKSADSVTVTYNFGNGQQTATFSGVRAIAYFGGTGNDTYVNNSFLTEAAYGSAGNDTLIGGFGDYSILKGSGGNDSLTGRAAMNDLSGNGGTDLLNLVGEGILRIDSFDTLTGRTPIATLTP